MARIIVLRLHPDKPVTGEAFQAYLKDLRIDVFDASFAQPDGGPPAIGSTAPPSKIVQHEPMAVASAMIVLKDPPAPEYSQPDIVVHIIRAGQIVRKLAAEYNVAVHVADPSVAKFEPTTVDPTTVAAYIELPDPKSVSGSTDAVVNLVNDGTPPSFESLKLAVMKVLISEGKLHGWSLNQNGDPMMNPNDPSSFGAAITTLVQRIGSLTTAERRHIAREITWNRRLDPIPSASKETFERMHTLPAPNEPLAIEDANARQQFQALLVQYRATYDADAETLARYIFALSAAVACESKSASAARAGLSFPIQPNSTVNVQAAELVLEN